MARIRVSSDGAILRLPAGADSPWDHLVCLSSAPIIANRLRQEPTHGFGKRDVLDFCRCAEYFLGVGARAK